MVRKVVCFIGLLLGMVLFLPCINGSFIPVAYADEPEASGNYSITSVTQYSSDLAVTVLNLTDGNYFAVYRNGTNIGSTLPVTGKIRSIPQMFSDPSILKIRFYSDSAGTDLVATATLNTSLGLIITPMTGDNCFIATAAFGSKFEPAVVLLRQFRDECLLSNSPGQLFVKSYYHYSPPLAGIIAGSEFLKTVVRILLIPLILLAYLCLHPLWILVFIFGGLLFKRVKKKSIAGVIPLILLVFFVSSIVPVAIAATINDVDNNSLRIGNDLYSLNSDNLTDANINTSLSELNQVYFKIGGLWYDVLAAQSDAELGVPANALSSTAIAGWTTFDTWFKAGSEVVTITNIVPPAAPSGLTATAAGSSQINISWAAVTGASSYNVYRATAQAGPYSKIVTINTNSYSSAGLTASTNYWYRITAVNSAGEGSFSLSVNATTLAGFDTYLNNARTYYSNEQYDEAIAACDQALLLSTTNAEVYVIRGASYIWLGQYSSVVLNDFNAALAIDPNMAEAYSGKGWYYLYNNQYSNAIPQFNSAIGFDPTLALSYEGRGICNAYAGYPQSALQDFSSFVQYDPNNADAYFLRAATHFELDNNQASIADYNQVILLDPQNGYAFNNRGAAYYMKGETQTAINDYIRATQLVSGYSLAYNNLGVAYDDLERYRDAVNAYNMSTSIDSEFALAYSNLGKAYAYLGEYQNALSAWAQAIEIDPELEPAYNSRGWFYLEAELYSLAVTDFDTALQLSADTSMDDSFNPWRSIYYRISSERSGAFNGRGWSNYYLDMYTEAIGDFSNCLSLNPEYANAYEGIGWSYYQLDNYDAAISNFTDCIELVPNDDGAYNGRACSYFWQGNYAAALSDFTELISLNPTSSYAYNWRGWTNYDMHNFTDAVADFTNSIYYDPTNDNSYNGRGWAYYRMGSSYYSLAEADFRACLSLNPNNSDAQNGLRALGITSFSIQSIDNTPTNHLDEGEGPEPIDIKITPAPKGLFKSTPLSVEP